VRRLLPAVLRVNLRALRQRRPQSPALVRFREIAAIVTGRPEADADEAVAWVEALVRALSIPGLSRWGATDADVDRLVAKAGSASSMKGNPIELDDAELAEIARASL
jgi:alcohol dehydrogenase class IV